MNSILLEISPIDGGYSIECSDKKTFLIFENLESVLGLHILAETILTYGFYF